ncbi:MAG: HD domain-containing protein [Lachnospiraceae bacterium]|nr:HD domain-containing protein [Lachnospiraceae bacterium]
MKTFAAIYIGSYELSMKIFEISARRGIHTIDHIRHRMELGKDVYGNGFIGYETTDALCRVLQEFHDVMHTYRVDDYRVCTGTLLKDAKNYLFFIEQIRLRTNLEVEFLSNSEERFMVYCATVCAEGFDEIIGQSTAIVDVGGSSLQITLFLKGRVITTQQFMLGMMRLREKLSGVGDTISHYEKQVQELVDKELSVFQSLYLEGKDIRNILLMGDYSVKIMKNLQSDGGLRQAGAEQFLDYLEKLQGKGTEQLAEELNLTSESDPLIVPALVVYRSIARKFRAKNVYTPGMDVTDGIAFDYAQRHQMLKIAHDFDEDVLSAARHLAKRYFGYEPHLKALQEMSLLIFDALKKAHGLGRRERLLLQVAAILHDCGKYVSLVNGVTCSYQIIMASEILGLTQLEQQIVASAVLYNTLPLDSYEELADKMDAHSYLTVTKLAAILRVANALDHSHKQKVKNVRAGVSGKKFVITFETEADFTLEKELFYRKAELFEEVFSLKPTVKAKKIFNHSV